jgi:hypothetical protein
MRVAVVGHVEWAEFARVESVPHPGGYQKASVSRLGPTADPPLVQSASLVHTPGSATSENATLVVATRPKRRSRSRG